MSQTPTDDDERQELLRRLRKTRAKRQDRLAKLKDTAYRACISITRKTTYLDPDRLKQLLEEEDSASEE